MKSTCICLLVPHIYSQLVTHLHPYSNTTATYSVVTATVAAPTDHADDIPCPFLEEIWHVPDGVAMWQEVPSARAMPAVVEPRAEDEVRGDEQE